MYSHFLVSLGSYRKSPFVTGNSNSSLGLKTEILDYDAGQWNDADDYPFSNGDRYIYMMKCLKIYSNYLDVS